MKFNPLSPPSYKIHRAQLVKELMQGSIAILHSNDKYPVSADQFFPFRQNKDLLRLCGIYQEDTALVLFPEHPVEANRELLFIKRINKLHKIWDGHLLDKETAQKISGISTIYWFDEFEKIIYSLIPKSDIIYLNSNEKTNYPQIIQGRNERLGKLVINEFPFHRIQRLQPILRSQNLIKSQEEINKIRKAVKLTGETWNYISQKISPSMYEYEIAAEISYQFEKNGAIHAFPPIVAAGKSACTLHYTANDQLLFKDDLVLIDFGAEVDGYAADMTRCAAIDGTMTKRQFEVYDQVLNLFQQAKEYMKPGVAIREINDKINEAVIQTLRELNLISTEESNDIKIAQKFLPHGVSHFLGMDVHDYGDKHTILEPNMVITCEPGLYIENEGIGIRLENDILITESGNVDLMEAYPL